jgi:hypothetical protein
MGDKEDCEYCEAKAQFKLDYLVKRIRVLEKRIAILEGEYHDDELGGSWTEGWY